MEDTNMNELQIIKLENTDISGWNFAMLRAELQSRLDTYAGIIYTDETIKDAKNDRTTLNKVKKVIEDARKAYKARCLAPYDALEPEIKELVDMVEKQRVLIDETVKDYETRQKEAKELEVRKYYDRKAVVLGNLADGLYPRLFDKKWTNATTARNKYEEGIMVAINAAAADIDAIRSMNSPFVDTLLEVYAETLSLEQVKAKQTELDEAAKKASLTTVEEAAAVLGSPVEAVVKAEQAPANTEDGVAMKIYATQNQMNQITDFMKAIGIRYELI